MLTIGVDTLFEDPYQGSSAVNFLIEMIRGFSMTSGNHRMVVLGSRYNRPLFEPLLGSRDRFVVAGISNEIRPLRILTQQLIEPLVAVRSGVDVLYAAGNTFPLAWRRPAVLKVNSLHHIHTPSRIGYIRSLYRRVMFHESARRANYVIANSAQTRSEFIRYMNVDPDRVKLVYEAVADEFVAEAPAGEAEAIERKFGVPRGYALFASTLWEYKNPALALEAFLAAEPALPPHVHFVVAGKDDGGTARRLERRAVEAGRVGKFHYVGAINNREIPALFRQAGVYMYPSSSETFGKPVLEAYRTLTPVLAADIPTLREVGGDGALFLPLNVSAWRDALLRVYRDRALREQLVGIGARRGAAFSWTAVVDGTLSLLHAAASHP